MPKAKIIESTVDAAGKTVKVGDRIAYTMYNMSELKIAEIIKITAGTVNTRVYVHVVDEWTNYRGDITYRTEYDLRRPAKNVVKV